MIATATKNNLRGVSPTPFNLAPSAGVVADFQPSTWVNGSTPFEAFVQIEIPGLAMPIPKQRFEFHHLREKGRFILESLPSHGWPKITLELEADNQGVYQSKWLELIPSSDTANAEIKYTRVWLSLVEARKLVFEVCAKAPLRVSFDIAINGQEPELLKALRRRAKIYRKLGFLEKVFHHEFNLPSELSAETVAQIETLFRGITEGHFTTRLESVPIMVDNPATVDLEQPPWSRPGYIRHLVGEREELFGTTLDTGPIWLEAFHAGIGSYTAIRQIEQRVTHPVEALFGLLDHQITFCFERYANRSPKERESRLKQYLHELSLAEPKSIYDLTLESLASDVTEKEADILSMGWLSIHRFHDRYCSQKPEFDVARNAWSVPLWLTYPSGKGGPLATLFVDAKTGIVTSSLPIPEIKIRGKQLAQQLLHASETALSQTGD